MGTVVIRIVILVSVVFVIKVVTSRIVGDFVMAIMSVRMFVM